MRDINSVNITGNLTAEPELRATASGTAVLNFRIASNYSVKNKQTGEWEDRPNYVSCTVIGARAEPLSKLLSKGEKVAVSGSLRYHEWEDKDGGKRSMLEIMVENVLLMTRKGEGGGQHQGQQAYQQPQGYQGYDEPAPLYDRDIPF